MPNSLWWKEGDCLRLWQQVFMKFNGYAITFSLHSHSVCIRNNAFWLPPSFPVFPCIVCFILNNCLICNSSVILAWSHSQLFCLTGHYCVLFPAAFLTKASVVSTWLICSWLLCVFSESYACVRSLRLCFSMVWGRVEAWRSQLQP